MRLGTLTSVVAAVALGCGGTEPEIPNISGTWTFSANITEPITSTSCSRAGTAEIIQAGANFSGTVNVTTGFCTFSDGSIVEDAGTDVITGGQIDGNRVSFQLTFCQLEGTMSGSPPNRMTRTETCDLAVSGQTFTFAGNWQTGR